MTFSKKFADESMVVLKFSRIIPLFRIFSETQKESIKKERDGYEEGNKYNELLEIKEGNIKDTLLGIGTFRNDFRI